MGPGLTWSNSLEKYGHLNKKEKAAAAVLVAAAVVVVDFV